MIRRFALGALAAHLLFALVWLTIGTNSEYVFERWAVTVAATILTFGYCVLVVAFYKARKTRLNMALAVNKFYLLLLFGALTLPSLWGVIWHDAPYRVVGNPYTFWIPPAWFRTYIYVFTSISVIGVLWEFFSVNWGSGRKLRWPMVDRRDPTRPGRRATDVR